MIIPIIKVTLEEEPFMLKLPNGNVKEAKEYIIVAEEPGGQKWVKNRTYPQERLRASMRDSVSAVVNSEPMARVNVLAAKKWVEKNGFIRSELWEECNV